MPVAAHRRHEPLRCGKLEEREKPGDGLHRECVFRT